MICQIVLHLLFDFKFIFIIIYSFASLITLDKILQCTWSCLFNSRLLLFLYAKYNSLLCLYDF